MANGIIVIIMMTMRAFAPGNAHFNYYIHEEHALRYQGYRKAKGKSNPFDGLNLFKEH